MVSAQPHANQRIRRRTFPDAGSVQRSHAGRAQWALGSLLLLAAAVAGIVLHFHPDQNAFDKVGFALRPPALNSTFFLTVTTFASPLGLVIGIVVAATAAAVFKLRDRRRILACLVGPLAAVAIDELVVKPLVGRRYMQELSFASGSVTVAAALVTAFALALPPWLRRVMVLMGAVSVAIMTDAVIALQWHYPSDAVGGACLGTGVVLVIDALAHVGRRAAPPTRSACRTEPGLEEFDHPVQGGATRPAHYYHGEW